MNKDVLPAVTFTPRGALLPRFAGHGLGKSLMARTIIFWKRTDIEGLERLELDRRPDGITATSTVICLEGGGFRLDHHWRLDPEWHALLVSVERWNARDHGTLRLERAGAGWLVNGARRTDLDGTDEPDLSVTPFCNTLAIRHVPRDVGAAISLDTAYVDGQALTVARSSQRYVRQAPRLLRYIDLGLSRGFEADLTVDEHGIVRHYQHLFERVG